MTKAATIQARIHPSLKSAVEEILHRLGLSPSEAINVFYRQIALHNGLPFDVRIPNAATRKAMRESLDPAKLTRARSVEELKAQLGHAAD